MPSSVVHRYIGLDTLNKLDKKPYELINSRLGNYVLYFINSIGIVFINHLIT